MTTILKKTIIASIVTLSAVTVSAHERVVSIGKVLDTQKYLKMDPSKVQEYVLRNEMLQAEAINIGTDMRDQLLGLCIRSFMAYCHVITGKIYPTEVFRVGMVGYNLGHEPLNEKEQKTLDKIHSLKKYDTVEIDIIIRKAQEAANYSEFDRDKIWHILYAEQLPFTMAPLYQGIKPVDLLDGKKVLINIRDEGDVDNFVDIHLDAYIPTGRAKGEYTKVTNSYGFAFNGSCKEDKSPSDWFKNLFHFQENGALEFNYMSGAEVADLWKLTRFTTTSDVVMFRPGRYPATVDKLFKVD